MSEPSANRARSTHSLFFAIHPDEAARADIADHAARLRVSHKLKTHPIPADRLHITLHYLGAFDGVSTDIVRNAMDAASGLALPPAEVTLNRIESFSSRRAKRPLVLAGDATESLASLEYALGAALEANGIAIRRHAHFTPHITLMYDEHRIARQAISPIEFRAHEFTLMRSLLGKSRHETLARWPLIG